MPGLVRYSGDFPVNEPSAVKQGNEFVVNANMTRGLGGPQEIERVMAQKLEAQGAQGYAAGTVLSIIGAITAAVGTAIGAGQTGKARRSAETIEKRKEATRQAERAEDVAFQEEKFEFEKGISRFNQRQAQRKMSNQLRKQYATKLGEMAVQNANFRNWISQLFGRA